MTTDELAIRDLIARWTEASAQSDYAALEPLMHPDVVFLTCGNEPFGRERFRAGFLKITETMNFQGSTEVLEVRVDGELAYARAFVDVQINPKAGGAPIIRQGHVLSVYKRNPEGHWQLFRDANLMTA